MPDLKIFCLLVTLMAAPAVHASTPSLTDSLEQVKNKISHLTERLATEQKSRSEEQARLAQLELATSKALTKQESLVLQMKEKNALVKKLKQAYAQAEAQQEKQQALLATQLRHMSKQRQDGPLKMLLNQSDMAQSTRMLSYYPYLHRARTSQLSDLLETLRSLDAQRQQLVQEQALLEQLSVANKALLAQLAEQKKEKEAILAAIAKRIVATEQSIQVQYEEQYELERLLMSLHQTLVTADLTSESEQDFSMRKGQLHSPLQTVELPLIPKNGHLMIEAAEGTPVRAIHSGWVIFSGWLRGYGLLTIVDHGEGYMSLYGHNAQLLKQLGEPVDTHEIIAKVGATGGQRRPGLYFEIRQHGQPLNLVDWLQRNKDRKRV